MTPTLHKTAYNRAETPRVVSPERSEPRKRSLEGCAFAQLDGGALLIADAPGMRPRRKASGCPSALARAARCTCREAIRFPDERSEELCVAKSQEGARSQEAARVLCRPYGYSRGDLHPASSRLRRSLRSGDMRTMRDEHPSSDIASQCSLRSGDMPCVFLSLNFKL